MPEPTALAALPRDLRLTRPAFFSTWLSERIRWSDTDQIGHVNNLSFSAYFESGRTEFLRDAIEANKASHAVLVVAQMNVCYLGELHWPGEVHIGTAMLEIGRSAAAWARASSTAIAAWASLTPCWS